MTRRTAISVSHLEAIVHAQLGRMLGNSLMFGGTVFGVENYIWGMLDTFCEAAGWPLGMNIYWEFRKDREPKCPTSMAISDWFQDPRYGLVTEAEAAKLVVEHFIAYKDWLKEIVRLRGDTK